ncbi:MAG: hypothetical protein K8E24_013575, partial [Methanobacterium paludis]|nr:hypothetical protein [Methanobacterium paludis]
WVSDSMQGQVTVTPGGVLINWTGDTDDWVKIPLTLPLNHGKAGGLQNVTLNYTLSDISGSFVLNQYLYDIYDPDTYNSIYLNKFTKSVTTFTDGDYTLETFNSTTTPIVDINLYFVLTELINTSGSSGSIFITKETVLYDIVTEGDLE